MYKHYGSGNKIYHCKNKYPNAFESIIITEEKAGL